MNEESVTHIKPDECAGGINDIVMEQAMAAAAADDHKAVNSRRLDELGFESFRLDWLTNPDTVIWALVVAAFWQGCGLVMALFLAGLRGIDEDIWKAAAVDGIPAWRVYVFIVIPMLAPVFLTVVVLLSLSIVRAFDLVVALTNGGPGVSSDLPSVFMFDMAFRRTNLGLSAASAVVMLGTVLAILIPYLYVETRERA